MSALKPALMLAAACAFSGSAPARAADVQAASPPQAALAVLEQAFQYRSVIEGYRGHADQPLQSWREANDQVGRIGGWRVYTREAQQSEAPPQEQEGVGATPAAPASPAHGGHGAHDAHGKHGGRGSHHGGHR